MARIVILGAGISGHTAALHLKRLLPKGHEIVVVSPNSQWNWIPSNIWVGVGVIPAKKVLFPLRPVYRRKGITFLQAKAVAIRPEGDADSPQGAVDIVYTQSGREGTSETVRYDYLINATGPQLNFAATPGLGPDVGHTVSVCTADHADEAAEAFAASIAAMRRGERQVLVVGTGHGACTCEGAAFEYTFNVDHSLREAGVRDMAQVVYLTNEHELGDFGVDGMVFRQQGYETTSKLWTESLFRERDVTAIVGAGCTKIEDGTIHYQLLDGSHHALNFDFAMLLPPFTGVPLQAYDRSGADISEQLFNPAGFMKVDADYTPKSYDQYRAADWPETYQVPGFDNIWAIGIAFAPPHPISKLRKAPDGSQISPAPPRTGMPSGVMGKTVAITIVDRIKGLDREPHKASMASHGAACVASAGTGLRSGSAAAMTMMPVVPDFEKYRTGRDLDDTRGEIGLHGHWVKLMLHYLFLYKARALPGWSLIPE